MIETRLLGASCCFSGIMPSHPTRAKREEMGRRVPGMHFSEPGLSPMEGPVEPVCVE